jgi:hypothetical protein
MKGQFQITGLGDCLVGTYALRNLTKYFQCTTQELLFLAGNAGKELEFTVYLLKFSYENALIQSGGAGALKIKPVEEIDLFLDTNEISTEQYKKAFDALWISIVGMTAEEYVEKNTKKDDSKPVEEEKKIGLTTGETLTKSDLETVTSQLN